MGASVCVRHVESGKIFKSMREAAHCYNINVERVNGKSKSLPGLTFERIQQPPYLEDRSPIFVEEQFKPIPGYEGLYSISNNGRIRSDKFKGRIKKIYTTKQGQHIVVLSKNSIPTSFSIEVLYRKVWLGLEDGRKMSNFKRSKDKPVLCVTTQHMFKSRKECCQSLGLDYSTFTKMCSGSDGHEFEIHELTFRSYGDEFSETS